MIRQRNFSRLLVGALLLALAVLLAACPGVGVPPAVNSVTIDQEDQNIEVDDTTQLTATVAAVGGADPAVSWSSNNEAVATVADGVVTAAAVGTATITATSVFNPAISDTVTVTVTAAPAVNSVNINEGSGAIAAGTPFTFTVTVVAVGGADTSVAWSSSNEMVATVDPTGAVTGVLVGGQATITATSTFDSTRVDSRVIFVADAVVTNGSDSGPGSLRQVIESAAPGDTVGFAWNVPSVLLTSVQLIPPVDARIHILQDLTLSGLPGDRRVTIESDTVQNYSSRTRLFAIPSGVTASLDNLILTGGDFIGNGGAIRNDGNLTVTNSTITGNTAWFRGGGIYNGAAATLLVQNSIISNNRSVVEDWQYGVNFCIGQPGTVGGGDCPPEQGTGPLSDGGGGGGIYNFGGIVTIENSVISDNEVKFSGGGLYNNGAGTMTLINTDVLNNLASDQRFTRPEPRARVNLGGGIYNQGTFSMTGGTVSGNLSALYGGGIANGINTSPNSPLNLFNVQVTNNTAENFEDPLDSFGGGLINYHTDPLSNLTIGTATITGNFAASSPNVHNMCTDCPAPLGVRVGPRPVIMPVFGDDGR